MSNTKTQASTQEMIEFLMNATEVERFHIKRTIVNQTIGEHSFGVAWFCWFLTDGKPSANLLMAALVHDLGEHVVGDMPAPTKRSLGAKFREELEQMENFAVAGTMGKVHDQLTVDEKRLLKLADAMEGMLFCIRERRMGNTRLAKSFQFWYEAVCNNNELTPLENRIVAALYRIYLEITR